jgi:hypothetical protein
MADSVFLFAFVVEGEGEVEAVPLLIRRICNELAGVYNVRTTAPVRVTKSRLLREGELERAIRLALLRNGGGGPIVIFLDADDDCPAELARILKPRALNVASAEDFTVVIPKCEFETWFLAAAESLSGKRGLNERLRSPTSPETIPGAKEWLSRNMIPGRTYSPTVDQAALVGGMDLHLARSSKSFDRLCKEVFRLLKSVCPP